MVPSSFEGKNVGMMTASSILATFIQQLRTEKGVYIETAMFEGMVVYNLVEHLDRRTFVPQKGPAGYARVLSTPPAA